MKKLFLIMAMIMSVAAVSQAATLSVGGMLGGGINFFRGADSEDMDKMLDMDNDMTGASKRSYNFNALVNAVAMFSPSLGVEVGLGFKYSTRSIYSSYLDTDAKYATTKNTTVELENGYRRMEVNLPIMLRGQFEYEIGVPMVSYFVGGLKLGFQLSDYMFYEATYNGTTHDIRNKTESTEGLTLNDDYNLDFFMLDISFGVGQEVKINDKIYLGLRISYDINVVSPARVYTYPDKNDAEVNWNLYHDDLVFSVTLRYLL